MGWRLDVIPRLEAESSTAAIGRVYAGGTQIEMIDGVPWISEIPGGEDEEPGRVTRAERAWMLRAVDLLQHADQPMAITDSAKEEGRRWPWIIDLESEGQWTRAVLYASHVSLRPPRWMDGLDEFAPWWRLIQAFARHEHCVAYSSDDDFIFNTCQSAARAYEDQWKI